MADMIIPPPDADGYWHFTYVTRDPKDGRWYGGKRSTKRNPLVDSYKGSGNWIRSHPNRGRLVREIIAFFTSSADVFTAEAAMVTLDKVLSDPFCMNQRPGGDGQTAEEARRLAEDPIWRDKNIAGQKRKKADPAWQNAHADRLRRISNNPVWQEETAARNRQKATDPTWLEANTAAAWRRKANPTWKENHANHLDRIHSDPVWKEAVAAANRRTSLNPEWRDAIQQRWEDPSHREKVKEAQRNRYKNNPELRVKLAEAIARRVASDPEYSAKMRAIANRRWKK